MVVAALVSALGAVTVSTITVIGARMAKHGKQIAETSTVVAAISEQVHNAHNTNLRDDLDIIRNEVRSGIVTITEQVHDLRVDLAWERRERQDLARRLTGEEPIA